MSEYLLYRQKLAQGLVSKIERVKERKPLPKISEKKKKEQAEIKKSGGDPGKKALDLWFHNIAYQIGIGECHCWECNVYIPTPFVRHATAHIFPKAGFRSVMTHQDNYLILGAGCCHDKTHTVESFKKMGVWREAVERFLRFEHLITREEKAKEYYTLFREAAVQSFPQFFNTINQ